MTQTHPADNQQLPPFPVAGGLHFRPLAAADVDGWLELMARIEAAEQVPWRTQRSELVAVVEDARNPVAENSVGGFDAAGVLRALGRVSKNPDGEKAHVMGGVDPEWRRRGVGSAILAWQEARVLQRFATDAQGGPLARAYGESDNAATTALLAGAGYSVVRYFSEMLRPLAGAPAVPLPAGIHVVSYTPDMNEAVRLAHNEAFADHWGSEPRSPEQWAVQMAHEHLRRDLSTVALDAASGEVAGYQIATVDLDMAAESGRAEGYTELLGVRRAWRGRGIAPAMLADAMARFAAAGLDHAALDVDTENPTGALGLYEGMGYKPIRSSAAWDKSL
ncbi:ribosomal protein S18 acetylase RimI-like enzyme [Arthrobacter stackebrandtii]|uniref:Ribosomal protein S18 acetylase RimI-like enzyme n=1 Tax=Arthrobacter stackebrandtii TaxID=272161 RepID=A0ABS4Z1Q6_9MICC|nr:GNAT family N-acetyltransferase [Arthrobacter stackebrandtii]MBP2414921.1 ribosomal protein S18 acetylase RimI-like enzyme [Arthrobacter stackebrandtii]PYH00912.1 GNAT family N-acetyltransferase [Arthrobacter stackebrandtii]